MTTNEAALKLALLPCPFCGGEAERITIDEPGDNFGGDVICCTRCQASSHVEFGRKENLVSRWNTRPAHERHILAAHELSGKGAMMTTANQSALKLARELHATFKKWGSDSPFWDDMRTGLAAGTFDADDTIQIALAAILEVTERAAGCGDDLLTKATWFRFCPSTGEFTGEYCSVRPHDDSHMTAMVPVEYIATALRKLEHLS